LDNVNAGLSDSAFIERNNEFEAQIVGAHSEPGDAGTPGGGADGDIKEELAAEFVIDSRGVQ
jgi:hypothetical protein